MNGKGRKYFENGDVYIGEWKDDVMNGCGILFSENGEKYEG